MGFILFGIFMFFVNDGWLAGILLIAYGIYSIYSTTPGTKPWRKKRLEQDMKMYDVGLHPKKKDGTEMTREEYLEEKKKALELELMGR